MLPKTVAAAVGLLLAGALAAGCARPSPSSSSSSSSPQDAGSPTSSPEADPTSPPSPGSSTPGMSGTDLPTLRPPTAPPRTPTDLQPTDRIVGTVTKGGTGPCYGMETDDGVPYALYGDKGVALTRGTKIRVQGEPLRLLVYCGQGEHVQILKVEIIG